MGLWERLRRITPESELKSRALLRKLAARSAADPAFIREIDSLDPHLAETVDHYARQFRRIGPLMRRSPVSPVHLYSPSFHVRGHLVDLGTSRFLDGIGRIQRQERSQNEKPTR